MKIKIIISLLIVFQISGYGSTYLDTIIQKTTRIGTSFVISDPDLQYLNELDIGYPMKETFIKKSLSRWLNFENITDFSFKSVGFARIDSNTSYLMVMASLKPIENFEDCKIYLIVLRSSNNKILNFISLASKSENSPMFNSSAFIGDNGSIVKYYSKSRRFEYFTINDSLIQLSDSLQITFPFNNIGAFHGNDTLLYDFKRINNNNSYFPMNSRCIISQYIIRPDSCFSNIIASRSSKEGNTHCFILTDYFFESKKSFSSISMGIFKVNGELLTYKDYTIFDSYLLIDNGFDYFELKNYKNLINIKYCNNGYWEADIINLDP